MTRRTIQEFWTWFQENAPRLAQLYEAKRFHELSDEFSRRLDAISTELPWEMGPGKVKRYSLTLSPEGNPKLSRLIRQALLRAPEVPDWELYSSRQPRQLPGAIRLPERRLSFPTDKWRFIPDEDRVSNRIHLTIIDNRLASADRDAALKAVSILLDQFLGEQTVETCIGLITVAKSGGKGKSYPILDLPEYIRGATADSRQRRAP